MLMHQDQPTPSILEARPEKQLPQSVDVLLSRMMAKRPSSRYQSMEQLRHDLERVKQGKAIGAAVAEGATSDAAQGPDYHLVEDRGFASLTKGGVLPIIVIATLVLALVGSGVVFLLYRAKNANNIADQSHLAKKIATAIEPQREPTAEQLVHSPNFNNARQAYSQCATIKSEFQDIDWWQAIQAL